MSHEPYITERKPTLTFWDIAGRPVEVEADELTKAECVQEGEIWKIWGKGRAPWWVDHQTGEWIGRFLSNGGMERIYRDRRDATRREAEALWKCVKDGRTVGDDLPADLQPFWECGEIVSASTDLVTVAFTNRTAYERCSSTDGSRQIVQALRKRFTEKTQVRMCFRRAA